MASSFVVADGGTNHHMAAVGIGSFAKRNSPVRRLPASTGLRNPADLARNRTAQGQAPTVPSTPSRSRSACPLCRPYSRRTCAMTIRSETSSPHRGW